MSVDKTTMYYIIVAATFLLNFAYVPLLLEVLQQRNLNNIPYLTIILILISQILLLFVVFYRSYYYHVFIYLVGFVCVAALLFLKPIYQDKNTQVINKNIYNQFIIDEE
tara:strand:- start:277 stop:603 length:327 start_codon:yes stop_codon:yes gene_type:complete